MVVNKPKKDISKNLIKSRADIWHDQVNLTIFCAATCNVSDESKDELRKVIDQLWTAHSTAGYTRPTP